MFPLAALMAYFVQFFDILCCIMSAINESEVIDYSRACFP